MLSLVRFPPPDCSTASHILISKSLLFRSKTNRTHLSFCLTRANPFDFGPWLGQMIQIKAGFLSYALKSGRKVGNDLLEVDDFGKDFEEDDDEGEVFVPLRNMRKWLEDKPRGFGEGKSYDTSIEDELLEEMEQSRQAQFVNINKLKNSPEKPNSKKDQLRKEKASEEFQNGIRVRLTHLPKKKNIHRDLKLAFKGFPGILDIIPVVSGNTKTRDPVCKGLAFVHFKSEDEANRFVQRFSRQYLMFGKTQKQIKCEIINPTLPPPPPHSPYEQSADGINYAPCLAGPQLEAILDSDFHIADSWEETVSDEFEDREDEHVSTQREDNGEIFETSKLSEISAVCNIEQRKEHAADNVAKLSSPEQKEIIQATGKKPAIKSKGEKAPKWKNLGSANRLKIREKAILTGVFSKYGVNSALAGREES